jgi:signal transduction histidine kinase/ActR/RegA family two-component response regulator
MAEMLNMSAESLLADDKILFQAIHPEDLDTFVQLNQEGIQLQQPFNWEGRFQVNEAVKWLHFKSTPETMENGDVLWHGVVADVTERKRYENEQLKMEKLESLGVLAGGIAHDFNNILTGIMGNISFAQLFLDAGHKSYKPLSEAEKASVRASELAHQLLTFARGGEPVKKVVSVQQLVSESLSLVLHGSNVKGSVRIPETIHAIEADEGQMSQLIHNIIINATQAMPGGGTLTITADNENLDDSNSLALPGGTYVRLTFADQGCGIAHDDLKRIFDPYFTTKETGNGLGLASVHSIVHRHGGHIGVSSVVDTGTTFTIHLPSIGDTYSSYQVYSASLPTGYHRGGSILVMDDEESIREMATDMLVYMGYQVTTCENGSEALIRYNAAREAGTPFSAVIMDLTIPGGMGGKDAALQILAIDPQACLIVSSGYSNDPIMSDFSAYGFSGSMAKPYNMTELGQQLGSLLSTQQSTAQPLDVIVH